MIKHITRLKRIEISICIFFLPLRPVFMHACRVDSTLHRFPPILSHRNEGMPMKTMNIFNSADWSNDPGICKWEAIHQYNHPRANRFPSSMSDQLYSGHYYFIFALFSHFSVICHPSIWFELVHRTINVIKSSLANEWLYNNYVRLPFQKQLPLHGVPKPVFTDINWPMIKIGHLSIWYHTAL